MLIPVEKLRINGIPAVMWGEKSDRLIIAVHGNRSSKIDDCIWIFAEEAAKKGYQTLSFDLPQHGERVYETNPLMADKCVAELKEVMMFARNSADHISVFGCSMGAYFSLLAYGGDVEKAWFLSPVTDMERIICKIMHSGNVTEDELRERKIIETPIETLYWDYFVYVRNNPVEAWNVPTFILRGENDILCEREYIDAFAERFGCELMEQRGGEHWFHTDEELKFFRNWLSERL